jgi:hypothetical protein
MDPDSDVTAEVHGLLNYIKPADYRPPDGKIRISLRTALYAAITVLSMAALLFGSSRVTTRTGYFAEKPPYARTIQIPAQTNPTFRQIAFTDQQIPTAGKITSPIPYAITDRTVTITGYTSNIPIDTPFVWLVVDVPSIGRCWPKKPTIQPNGTFQATIFEGGPNMDYTVSLYAVGYGLNKTIEHWLVAGTFGGLPMIPQQYRLDSVRLSLNGV